MKCLSYFVITSFSNVHNTNFFFTIVFNLPLHCSLVAVASQFSSFSFLFTDYDISLSFLFNWYLIRQQIATSCLFTINVAIFICFIYNINPLLTKACIYVFHLFIFVLILALDNKLMKHVPCFYFIFFAQVPCVVFISLLNKFSYATTRVDVFLCKCGVLVFCWLFLWVEQIKF